MVEKWSEKDLANLEYAKKHYRIGKKAYPIKSDSTYHACLLPLTKEPYLYRSDNGVWIIADFNIRNHNGVWAKLEQPINKIYELW